ncbi:MAG: protein kinase, partial [Phycisphaerales bacterium]|nr:protein kinase [Phycisphaerales bacterium]
MESTWLNESTPEEQRLRLAIAEIRARRAAGDLLSDEEAAAAYPQLAPRLAAELRKLAIVQQARRSAHYSEQCRAAPGHAGAPLAANAIPGYELRGEIHRGSQGVVYLATHCSTGREVAIKVMKHGPFADAFDRLRFEREVRVLGALKHPNIVSIYDSGIALGHSYFVMDYIAGRPLDAYVEQSGRDVPAILRLFTKVCDAVSAAHICGVIHRDLKPGNIRIDDRGEPHILDFGLAKLDDVNVLNGAASPRRAAPADVPPDAFTQTGQFVGSLPWASPEQAEGVGANIDIRTDVYSLGVVLYQALTGRFPYAISGALRTVLDTIQSAPPRPPSQVRREINDEVETIVLKCLQKDRARRYQSAADLSQDLQRYLRGEPIDAKRDSRLYLLRKQFRRNRISVLAALSVFISLIAGIIATTRSTNRALQAEADALALARAESRLREQAQWEAYKASLAAADAALSANNAAMAKARLESAPLSHRGWEWRYLNARLDQSLRSYALPSTLAARPVITPDHSRVFAPLTNGEIQSIDPSTGEMRQFASIGSPDITTLAISADGTRLAVGMRDGAVRLLDAFSSRELLRFRSQHAGPISAIAFAPNGSAIVTGGGDDDQSADSIRLWNASTGQQLIDFGVPSSWVNYLAFDPSGRVLASGHTKAPPGFRL